jgi:hypothetical protein
MSDQETIEAVATNYYNGILLLRKHEHNNKDFNIARNLKSDLFHFKEKADEIVYNRSQPTDSARVSVIPDIEKLLFSIKSSVINIENEINNYKTSANTVVEDTELLNTIKENLAVMAKDSSYKITKDRISKLYKDVTVDYSGTEYNLGDYRINIQISDFEHFSNSREVYNSAYGDLVKQLFSGDPGPIHPHIDSDGHICFGEGGAAANNALANGRIIDFFDIVEAIITTYNDNSPYSSIESFFGETISCADCGTQLDVDNDSYYQCSHSGDNVCEGCVVFDHDDEPYLANHVKYCGDCEQYYTKTESNWIDIRDSRCRHCIENDNDDDDDDSHEESSGTSVVPLSNIPISSMNSIEGCVNNILNRTQVNAEFLLSRFFVYKPPSLDNITAVLPDINNHVVNAPEQILGKFIDRSLSFESFNTYVRAACFNSIEPRDADSIIGLCSIRNQFTRRTDTPTPA